MGGGRRGALCGAQPALVFGCVLAWSASAWADGTAPPAPPDAKPLKAEYQAPEGCPTQGEFQARVRARTALAVFLDPSAESAGAGSVHVTIHEAGSSYKGHLAIFGRGTAMSARDVADERCADLVDAIALITALRTLLSDWDHSLPGVAAESS